MVEGRLNKEIAYQLGLSEKTVKMHRAHLLTALRVRSSAEAIRIAVEASFVNWQPPTNVITAFMLHEQSGLPEVCKRRVSSAANLKASS
jgi:hypothetical protein